MKKQVQFILISFLTSILIFVIANINILEGNESLPSLEIFALLSSFFLASNCYWYTSWFNILHSNRKKEKKSLIYICLTITCLCIIPYYLTIHASSYYLALSYVFNSTFFIIYRKRILPWQKELQKVTKNTMLEEIPAYGSLEEYKDITLGEASSYGINNIIALKQGIFEIAKESIKEKEIQYQNCKITSIKKEEKILLLESILRIGYKEEEKKKYKKFKVVVEANAKIKRKKICPSCGFSLKTEGSDKCPYCKTNLVNINNELNLKKIQEIKEKKS